jgi:hypothetical protein
VVSRGLIEQLNRDELEGALAHLVASIGNGDLRIAFRVTSVFETCGILVAIINAPFGRRSRGTLWRIVRYGLFGNKDSESAAQEAAAMSALLTRSVGLDTDVGTSRAVCFGRTGASFASDRDIDDGESGVSDHLDGGDSPIVRGVPASLTPGILENKVVRPCLLQC